jgi:hypothetical protein
MTKVASTGPNREFGFVAELMDRIEGRSDIFTALSVSAKAVISYRNGKRDSENTGLFIGARPVIETSEISTDG